MRGSWATEARERASLYWAADVSWYSSHADRWISSGFEFDKCTRISLSFRDERSAAVLVVAFGITDVQHLLKGNRTFTRWLHQVNLTQDCIRRVKATSMTGWLIGSELITSLTHEQPNSHGSRCIWPVGAADAADYAIAIVT